MPLPRREPGVQHRQVVADQRCHPIGELGDQRDLRHEHQGAAAVGKDRRDRCQVDIGLAGRGDPFEQQLAACAQGTDAVERLPLLVGQQVLAGKLRGPVRKRIALDRLPLQRGSAPRHQSVRRRQHRSRRHPDLGGKVGNAHRPLAQCLEDRALQRGAADRRSLGGKGAQHADPLGPHLRRSQRPSRDQLAGPAQTVGGLVPLRPECPLECRIRDPVVAGKGEPQGLGQRGRVGRRPAPCQPRLQAGRQHRRDRGAERRAVVGGDLLGERQQVGREHRRRDDGLHRSQLDPGLPLGHPRQEVAERQATSVWHEQERAGGGPAQLRWEVVAEGSLGPVGERLDCDAHRLLGGQPGHHAQTWTRRGGSRRASAWMISQICSTASSGWPVWLTIA